MTPLEMMFTAQERDETMGEKGKGKDSGKSKKKAMKAGNRPHEQRERGADLKKATE